MNSSTTTFWNLLFNIGIEIPIIQRDYAQGRLGKEELRRAFLHNLREALDGKRILSLDFVYGTTVNGKLIPLDGQQRLTTLWLLHWYLAYHAEKLIPEAISACLKKFSYETRNSSRAFCKNLAEFWIPMPSDKTDISEHIKNQSWFRRAWSKDPTVQSMLRMLSGTSEDRTDGIVGVFGSSKESCSRYWERLTSAECPIVFRKLDLFGIQHSDDLYIKMNARGKPLTSFENFKADLVDYIGKAAKGFSAPNDWEALNHPSVGFPIKMDTEWMDVFWQNRQVSAEGNKAATARRVSVDEICFAFFNRFFFNEVCLAKTNDGKKWLVTSDDENANISYRYLNDSGNGRDYDRKIAYNSFVPYRFQNGEIPVDTLSRFKKTLETVYRFIETNKGKKVNDLIPSCQWEEGFKFIPEYIQDGEKLKDNSGNEISKITVLSQPQRVVFFAICKFFWDWANVKEEERKDEELLQRLKRWLRVVWNLVSVKDGNGGFVIRTFDAMRKAMDFVNSLDSQNVYECLEKKLLSGDTTFDLQCKEEKEKAAKIVDGGLEWERKIIEAENYAFFHGAIRFLFQDAEGNVKWDDFDKKFKNAQCYFDLDGIKVAFRVSLTKGLVSQCSNWEQQLYDKQIFNPNASTWYWILCAKNWERPVHNILMCEDLKQLVAQDHLGDKNVNKYVKPILASLPYEEMVRSEPEGRFKWNGAFAFYRPYAQEAMFTLDWEGFERNRLLSELVKEGEVELQSKYCIAGTNQFFRGWNVSFNYKSYCFCWRYDNQIQLLDKDVVRISVDAKDRHTVEDIIKLLEEQISKRG